MPTISIVIPTFNRKEKLLRLIDSILANNYPTDSMEVIVVDDMSTDGTARQLAETYPIQSIIKIISAQHKLFAAGSRNAGIKQAKGDIILLVDDDNVLDQNCVSELVHSLTEDHSIGICGPMTYYLQDPHRIWFAGLSYARFSSLPNWIGRDQVDKGQFNTFVESNFFPNAFAFRKEIIVEVGLFDEEMFPIAFEDSDFCQRVMDSGYRIVCNPLAKIWHDVTPPSNSRENRTRSYSLDTEVKAYYVGRNRVLFVRKHSSLTKFLLYVPFNLLRVLFHVPLILRSDSPRRVKIARAL